MSTKKQETHDWEAVRQRLKAQRYGVGPLSEGRAIIENKDGKCGFVDAAGCVVVPLRYSFAADFGEGRAMVKKDGLWGFVAPDGTEVVPLKYDNAWPFSEGRAAVEKDGKCGFIDTSGTEVVPIQYDDAEHFIEGRA